MDAATVQAMLRQHFDNASTHPELAHAMYHEHAVLEFPQSGERFEGVENFREWRSNYPANTSFEFREVRGEGDVWGRRAHRPLRRGPREFRPQRPRAPRRQDRPGVDLHRRGLRSAGVAGQVEIGP